MTFGQTMSKGELREKLLSDRDARIVAFMKQNRSVAAIAALEGLEIDYCRKAVNGLKKSHVPDYQPISNDRGHKFADDSRQFRNNLSNLVADYRNRPDKHYLDLCHELGLTQSQQVLATEKGGQHDFTLSQLERLAEQLDMSFPRLLLTALIDGYAAEDKEKLRKVLEFLNF